MLLPECQFPTQPLGGGMREYERVQRQFANRFWVTEWWWFGSSFKRWALYSCRGHPSYIASKDCFHELRLCFDWCVLLLELFE